MEYTSAKGYSGWGQAGMLLAFLGGGFLLAAVVQLVIYMQILPGRGDIMNPTVFMEAIKDPANVNANRLAQVLGTFCLMCLPAVAFAMLVHGKNMFWLGFNRYLNWKQVSIGFAIIFFAGVAAGPLADLSKAILSHFPRLDTMAAKMENEYNEQVMAMSNLKNWGEYIVAIFIMAFFPAMFEEMLFRGAMQNLLVKWWKAPLTAIIVSSLIFSLIHFSLYLFLSRALLGFVLGLMYYKSKNIWVNIIAHFLNNFIAVTQLFILSGKGNKIDPQSLDTKVDWWWGLAASACMVVLFIIFDKFSSENKMKIYTREQILLAEADPFHSIANKNPES
ncbi:MAG: hypothetical protein ABS68_05425 [Niastella sp. SCN 39-18]|nr:CPBP family intramembrane metalloprotease [Sphingobacteriales bacterium]ODT53520.1 MAG: hypothetical protein ABS68_05425 [Niastella sp. SCN 39-18]OJW11440.1 MAG: hypothetical protein BGO53_10875 [Sphingobacteriales bacterium 39-19]